MSTNATPSAGAGGQAQRRPQLFKAEDLSKVSSEVLSDADKAKYAAGLNNLWKVIDSEPAGSQASQEAKRKVLEFSNGLQTKIERTQGTAAQRQGQPSQAAPAGGATAGAAAGAAAAGASGPGRPSPALVEHVNRFKYVLPPRVQAGSAEATQWLQEARNRYYKALMTMEAASTRVRQLDATVKERNSGPNPLSDAEKAECAQKRDLATKNHTEAKRFVDDFRRQQMEAAKAQGDGASGAAQSAAGTAPPAGTAAATTAPPRPPMTGQQAQNTALQNSTQTVNAAIEAARNQQMNGGRPQMPSTGANTGTPASATPPTQPVVKTEPGTSQPVAAATAANTPTTASQPASAVKQQAAGAVNGAQTPGGQLAGQPRPLTQQGALAQVARTYSNNQGSATPTAISSHSHPSQLNQSASGVNNQTPRMPIPKTLPEKLQMPPQPVPMQSPRPTISGGASAQSGSLNQPGLQKPAGVVVEGDGDRVMNKKKLDELVRQVCGGQYENGEGLSPEVEESMLQVADEFVDNVITAACKCAKARGSKFLEIRDLQLVLERNYNIRIPGYASDELRTVRKFQPAQGWVAKMSAVQAAKVTGGKTE